MPRRSKPTSKNKNNLIVYIIIGAVVIVGIIIGKSMLDTRAEHFAGVGNLPISEYKQNPLSFSGNEHRVSGKISEKLKWTPDQGQLIAITVDQEKDGKGTLPIMIPANVDKINLERGHNYTFKVEIDREGLAVASDIKAK